MALKTYTPYTPSMRHTVLIDRSSLWKGGPEKTLSLPNPSSGGRSNTGRLTAWKKGGGVKNKYRIIDFKRNKFDIQATVQRIEYDPNRTAFIALLKYSDDEISYIIAPQNLKAGDTVISSKDGTASINYGNAMPISNIPVGTYIHNLEAKPGHGAQIARAAGGYAQIAAKDGNNATIKLRSGEVISISSSCIATIGIVSNPDNQNVSYGKAGRKRLMGVRPTVRGVAMNPVDHPHGGGEGKSSGGRHPVTPWGQPTKGYRTGKHNKRSGRWIKVNSRHNKKGK